MRTTQSEQSRTIGRVLVIDDEQPIVDYLTQLLEIDGHTVASANDGVTGLEKAGSFKPDIVLLDIQMPAMNGLEVCRVLRSNSETQLLPVVFITGMGDKDTKIACIAAGSNDFLNKPFDRVELTARVRSLIQLKHLTDQLESVASVFYSFALTVEAKDPYTHGHSERVADYTARLAAELGLSMDDQMRLRHAGVLHDIGKIGVREQVLHKPDRLTEEEFQEVRSHPEVGERILQPLRFAQPYLPAIRHHHERFDGKGYPDSLSGMEIPLDARLMAIADAYDAMTSDRPYRKALAVEAALIIMQENQGPQWEPELLRAFFAMIRKDLRSGPSR